MQTSILVDNQHLISNNSLVKKNPLTYRKDIDGLRAIAVLSVVLYHIFSSLVPGGFVGVDIFFVISGYLISKHILSDLEIGKFSLKNFYTRRIRRILPAFLFCLLIVSITGFLILTPLDLRVLTRSVFAATLSSSNLYFWRFISLEYFGTDASILPLLHTWSLGVEEQFYLIWPITLLILFQGLNKLGKKSWLGLITLILGVISFFLYYYFRYHVVMVFYTPVTRAFELLLGASLAIYWYKLKTPLPWVSFLLSLTGLFLIVYTVCCFGESDYPSAYILLPCLGSALLIYAGETHNTIRQFMSLPLMVFLGLISYSFYLWHWPLVAYANYLGIEITIQVGVLIFFLSLILAMISYFFIEQPFRRKYTFNFKKSVLVFVVMPFILAFSFVVASKLNPNLGFNKISQEVTQTIDNYLGPFTNTDCINSPPDKPGAPETCSIGDKKIQKTEVLIVGDSHAMASAGMLDVILKDAHLKGYLVTHSGSAFILGNIKDWRKNLPMKRNALVASMIANNHYKYVILGGFWNYYPDSRLKKSNKFSEHSFAEFKQGLDNAIAMILAAKSIPVLMMDIPPLLNVPIQCGFTRVSFKSCSNAIEKVEKVQAKTKDILLSMKLKYPNILLLDPGQVICQQGKCESALQGIPLYHTGRENSHLNYAGSVLIGEKYLQQFNNPLREMA